MLVTLIAHTNDPEKTIAAAAKRAILMHISKPCWMA